MHKCPNCGEPCNCNVEDIAYDVNAPDECVHKCELSPPPSDTTGTEHE